MPLPVLGLRTIGKACAAAVILLAVLTPPAAADILVFAAASTASAFDEVIRLYRAKGQETVTASFAASSTLAKQVANGAPAHLFVSANTDWMDYLSKRKAIDRQSRRRLLGNRLVLVAPAASRLTLAVTPGFSLAGALGDGRLALGDPDHVPAGIYARKALQSLGVWKTVKDKLARAANVRAALVLVERGEAPLGIVYGTDAAVTKKVRIVGEFPATSHPPIRYEAALVSGRDGPEARRFFDYLTTPEAAKVFARHGFRVMSGKAP